MATTLPPRPAATVLTLREAPNGYEILMVRRNVRSEFMGGVYVFPGGALDARDAATPHYGLDDRTAAVRLELAAGALDYYVACLRELFEETGLLIACDDAGASVSFSAADDVARLAAHRAALNAREVSFSEILEREGVRADLRGVEYLAHWITPEGLPRRFDTRFFVVLAPEGQVASHDESETTDLRWLRPLDALTSRERGEIDMVLPTVHNLRGISSFDSAHQVLDYARSLHTVSVVCPRAVARDGEIVILLPGDEGYDAPG